MVKRILISGAAGFVGSHFCEHILKETTMEIIGLVRLNTAGNLQRLTQMECWEEEQHRITIVSHDLKFNINKDIRDRIGNVDYIVHMGSNSHVDRSITHPKEFFEDNVIGAVNMLEYLRLYQPKARMINFGTDEVFGPAPSNYNFKEDDRYRPSNPYSGSKAGQMCAGHSYYVTYGLDILSTYTMNIFGERQNSEKLISLAMKRIINNEPIQIHSKIREGSGMIQSEKGHYYAPDPRRDVEYVGERHWLHARNASSAILFLLEKGIKGEHYNIVGDTEMQNDEIVKEVGKVLGKEPILEYVDFHKARPGHDRRYALDGTKLKEMGWNPPMSFEESLKKTVEWTMNHPEWQ